MGGGESEPADHLTVEINGFSCRVWQKGSGPKLGFLAGFGGLPRWIPFLDALAKERTVIVPSLPGFPGGERGHTVLDSHLDWVLAAHELLRKAGLDGADLAGSSVGGSLAAEVAAIWPGSVKRLALIAPFGLFDEKDPATDPWAQRAPDVPGLMCADPARWEALKTEPEGPELAGMADRADARRRGRRPHLLAARQHQAGKAPAADRGADPADLGRAGPHHAARLRRQIRRAASRAGPRSRVIPGAGHLAELDKPDEVAAAILGWTK